jgi:phosphoribosylaminoimidazole-succinocarboxamide synthase
MAAVPPAVTETHLEGLRLIHRGKVRDVYDLGAHLLIVATDRVSAYDSVLSPGIPDKGHILTSLSTFWFGARETSARTTS